MPAGNNDCLLCGFGEKCSGRGTPCAIAMIRVTRDQLSSRANWTKGARRVVGVELSGTFTFDDRFQAKKKLDRAAVAL